MPFLHLFSLLFRPLIFLFAVFYSTLSYGQLNNEVLLRKAEVKAENANEIRAELYTFGFFKNNEYFNEIADGYTLFGYHVNPSVIYYPASYVRLEAGVFLHKDFGSSGYQEIAPTFRAKVQKEKWALVFGTLEGNLNHGYIEPLYDFERVITDRLENGVQFMLHTDAIRLDSWIDWNRMLYRGENAQEEIAGGISSAVTLLRRQGSLGVGDSILLSLPVQFTVLHKGGQIDASILPVLNVVNAAVGLELQRQYPSKAVQRVYTSNYLLGYKTTSGLVRMPYEDGYGLYLNAGADTKYLNMLLSYWNGESYVTELGGKLYQSASTTFKHPDHKEENRELLILRLMKDFKILNNLIFTVRLEPHYDFKNSLFEYSHSFYLTFNTDFFVVKPRR